MVLGELEGILGGSRSDPAGALADSWGILGGSWRDVGRILG